MLPIPRQQTNLDQSIAKARRELPHADPHAIAGRADVAYAGAGEGRGQFRVRYLDAYYTITYPEGRVHVLASGEVAPALTTAILLHYLLTADGSPVVGQWKTFRELPDAFPYYAAFTGRSVTPLAEAFGNDLEVFVAAGKGLGGEPARTADASFYFRVLPKLPMMVQLWLKDEEMPASANILFDASAPHQLPIEDLSAVAATLSSRLRKVAGKR